jgi:hypothetical protein
MPVGAERNLQPPDGTNAFSMATSDQVKQSRQPFRTAPTIRACRKRIRLKFLAKVSLQRFSALPVRPEIKSISC